MITGLVSHDSFPILLYVYIVHIACILSTFQVLTNVLTHTFFAHIVLYCVGSDIPHSTNGKLDFI